MARLNWSTLRYIATSAKLLKWRKDMAENGYSEEDRVKAKRLIALIDKKLSS